MDEALKKVEQFHGHIGPYVVIGYKMGEIANQLFGGDPFSKNAIVCTGTKPPLSCIIDGIQMSSGCTLGKGNITVNMNGIPKAQFTDNNGKHLEIRLKTRVKQEIDAVVTKDNIISFSSQLYLRPNEELFDILLDV